MSRLRLRKSDIIKSSKTFDDTFRSGIRIHSEHLILVARSADRRGLGFAVSRRIKGAVKRNRAKRRLREIVRRYQEVLPQDAEMIFVAKPGTGREKFDTLRNEYLQLVKQYVNKCKSL